MVSSLSLSPLLLHVRTPCCLCIAFYSLRFPLLAFVLTPLNSPFRSSTVIISFR